MTLLIDLLRQEKRLPGGRPVKIVQVLVVKDEKVIFMWGVKPYPMGVPLYSVGDPMTGDGIEPMHGEYVVVHGESVYKLTTYDELLEPEVEDELPPK